MDVLVAVFLYFAPLHSLAQVYALKADGEHVCRTVSASGAIEHKCCYNHFEKDMHCNECPLGTLSENGEPCAKCKPNTYGFQCQHTCNCKEDFCNNVFGCVGVQTTVTNDVYSYMNLVQLNESTVTSHTTIYTETTRKPPIEHQENKITLYYIVSIGVVIVLILFCMLMLQIRSHFRYKVQGGQNRGLELSIAALPQDDVNSPYNGYDEIEDVPSLHEVINERNSYLSIRNSILDMEMHNLADGVENNYLDPRYSPASSINSDQPSQCLNTQVNIPDVTTSNFTGDIQNRLENRIETNTLTCKLNIESKQYERLSQKRDTHDYCDENKT